MKGDMKLLRVVVKSDLGTITVCAYLPRFVKADAQWFEI